MALSELESALIEQARARSGTRTPEALARRLGISLAEVREAEKSALRKLADPARLDLRSLAALDLEPLERDVLEHLHCDASRRTPEQLARDFEVPLLLVLEAQKAAMRHVQEHPPRPAEPLTP